MPRSFEGDLDAGGLRFAIVASRFNDEIVSGLLEGAIDCLRRHGAADDAISVFRVPGAFEIPTAVRMLITDGGYDAIVAAGCLIRGDTPHFDFISRQVTTELSRVSIEAEFPVAFGVITCNTYEQAVERSSSGTGNKGWEAALAAIEMARLQVSGLRSQVSGGTMGESYRDLIAWQKAMALVTEVYAASARFPKEELYGLTAQLRRAAVSIPSNIAEGKGRYTGKEYVQFVLHARGSLLEVETQLEIARNLGYMSDGELARLLELTKEIGRMINGLIRTISGKSRDLTPET